MGEQVRIVDLARHMITMSGRVPEIDVPIVYTGLRPGEKLFEELLTEEEEETRRVDRKILAAACPAPALDLPHRIEQLASAAAQERVEIIRELLQGIVPSYQLGVDQQPDSVRSKDRQKTDEASVSEIVADAG
jgi:FlaA1/EpsC-like NDP-sugar epimerase